MALSCIVFKIFDLEVTATLKFGSEVTRSHEKWYNSIV